MNTHTYIAPRTTTFVLPEKELMNLPLGNTGDHSSAPERIEINPD